MEINEKESQKIKKVQGEADIGANLLFELLMVHPVDVFSRTSELRKRSLHPLKDGG